MIPFRQSVALRTLARCHPAKLRSAQVIVARFQSSVPSLEEHPVQLQEQAPRHTAAAGAGTTQGRPSRQGGRGPSDRPPLNRKLREIRNQVKATIDSIKEVNDLAPAVEILEEALSYLREIQLVEGISEDSLYSIFQPTISDLLNKASKFDLSGEKSLEDIVDILVKYNVAHKQHFSLLVTETLRSVDNDEGLVHAFSDVLRIWVKFIEYSNNLDHQLHTRSFFFMREAGYVDYHIKNLVFFSYAMSCLKAEVNYDIQDAMKLLQTDRELPTSYNVRTSLTKNNLMDTYNKSFNDFVANIEASNMKSLDPNGWYVMQQMKDAISKSRPRALAKLYEQVRESSITNKIPVTELTINNIMNGFYTLRSFDNVFMLFQDILASGVKAPSEGTWDVVLRTLGHVDYLKRAGQDQREKLLNNFEATLATALKSGVTVSPKFVATVVTGYANFDKFDKAYEFMEKHKELPVIQSTKNALIIAYVLNNKTPEAEKKFEEFTQQDSRYKPSTNVMNAFLGDYARKGDFKAIQGIMATMKSKHVVPDIATYTILLDSYLKSYRSKGLVPRIDSLLAEIGINEEILENEFAMSALISGLARDGMKLDVARDLYAHASGRSKKIRDSPAVLTSLVRAEVDHGSLAQAEILFEKLTKIDNTARSWNLVITGLLRKDENLAMIYYEKLKQQTTIKSSVSPNYFTYYYLLDHFMKSGNSAMIQYVLDEISASGIENLGDELPKFLNKLKGDYKVDASLLSK